MAAILTLDLGSTQLKLMVLSENAEVLYLDSEKYPTDAEDGARHAERFAPIDARRGAGWAVCRTLSAVFKPLPPAERAIKRLKRGENIL